MGDLEGQQIKHYFIQQPLRSGGMADVYRAFDQQRKELVAFKVLRESFANQPQLILRFKREAEIAHQAGRPYLLHDCGKLDEIMDDLIDYVVDRRSVLFNQDGVGFLVPGQRLGDQFCLFFAQSLPLSAID